MEGYAWNSGNIKCEYSVKVERDTPVTKLAVGNLSLTGKEELDTAIKDGYYELTGSFDGTDSLSIEISCKKMYDLFYLVVLLAVFLLIAAGLVATLFILKKKKLILFNDTDEFDKI